MTGSTTKRSGVEYDSVQRCPACGTECTATRVHGYRSYTLWCYKCRKWYKLANEPKKPPERDSWVIELEGASKAQVHAALSACKAAGIDAKATRGTVDIIHYKRKSEQ